MAKAKANQNTSLLSWYYIAQKNCTGEFSHSSLVFILETIMATVEEWCRKTLALRSFQIFHETNIIIEAITFLQCPYLRQN
jgi:hypothetical protein